MGHFQDLQPSEERDANGTDHHLSKILQKCLQVLSKELTDFIVVIMPLLGKGVSKTHVSGE